MNHQVGHRPSTTVRLTSCLFILTLLLTACVAPAAAPVAGNNSAYIEPALLATTEAEVSAIVTATSAEGAAQAVKRLGGTVTSDLWLINAVAATISSKQIASLAAQPGIVSVVHNKGLQPSVQEIAVSSENGNGNGNDLWDGWANRKRFNRHKATFNGTINAPVTYLPNGSYMALDANGTLEIVNSNDMTTAILNLSGGPFLTAPVVGANGLVYIAGSGNKVHAVTATGTLQWTFSGFSGSNSLGGGVALGPNGNVYAATSEGRLYAIDGQNGALLWSAQPSASNFGAVLSTPIVAPDGTIYYTAKGNKKGHLFAVTPAGAFQWTFEAPGKYGFYQTPLVGADGTVYVASLDERVFALYPDGSLRYEAQFDGKILARPALGSDGSLYVGTDSDKLYGLNPDGSVRFTFDPNTGAFITSPLLSADGSRLFVAGDSGPLFAVDTSSGAALWSYSLQGDIAASSVFDVDGNIVTGSEGKDVVTLTTNGELVTTDILPDDVTQSPSISPSGKDITVRVGDKEVVTVGRLPEVWDTSDPNFRDVWANANCDLEHPSTDCLFWNMINPLSIDVGADQVHDAGIRGAGVTVAVVDSGVHFDDLVKAMLDHTFDATFLGQADFIDEECPKDNHGDPIGTQGPTYCYTNRDGSEDAFGHGSHVAGIVFNPLRDITTNTSMGVAPAVNYLSVRVLGPDGRGTYADAIEGIQFVVEHKNQFQIRILNLSLSAAPTTPYFVDPLNVAVEKAWHEGIVVVAAAGNSGPGAETITVPGNNPYVITVGAVDSKRTPGYWEGDTVANWSATGPTLDGFVKPDILAPGAQIVSLMYYNPDDLSTTSALAASHPDHSENWSLFRMNGTSMATAVVSGVAALMLEAHPNLTPDEVKFRLGYSARPAITGDQKPAYNIFQQGMGRIWAPTAVFGDFPANARANQGMDLAMELADYNDGEITLTSHYQGPVQKLMSDDDSAALYYIEEPVLDGNGNVIETLVYGVGASRASDSAWMDWEAYSSGMALWSGGMALWSGGMPLWSGNVGWIGGVSNPSDLGMWPGGMALWSGGMALWSGGMALWSGGLPTWSGGMALWSGGMALWSGGMPLWSGGMALWSGGMPLWSGGMALWSGSVPTWSGAVDTDASSLSATTWVGDDGTADPTPTPAPTNTPTAVPTDTPTAVPTNTPTAVPTNTPTAVPTNTPTAVPTNTPTAIPTDIPTAIPTNTPTAVPTNTPTAVPTNTPTAVPTDTPTAVPTDTPTAIPTNTPTAVPTNTPTAVPTNTPTAVPTNTPTAVPTDTPTAVPTNTPLPPAEVTTSQFVSAADTFVNEDKEDETKGDDSKFVTRPEAGKQKNGLLRFDLTSLPTGASIASATLHLTTDTSSDDHIATVHRMLTNWDEANASWNSPGNGDWQSGTFGSNDYDGTSYGAFVPVENDVQLSVNVTDLVNAWINGGVPNYGFLLLAEGSKNRDVKWYSRDEDKEYRRPMLTVEWTAPVTAARMTGTDVPLQEESADLNIHLFLPTVNR